ncbi:hypothetical protein L6R29_05740 [Myxococcota bacterium]|nr:hypothetical protein [Myxococcota bacterium]
MKRTRIAFFMFLLSFPMVHGCSCNGFPIPPLPEKLLGHCIYKNAFAGFQECKEYLGDWTVSEVTNDCKSNGSEIVLDKKCGIPEAERYGDCIFIVDKGKNKYTRVEIPGKDPNKCASMIRGCQFFGGGSFVPTPLCGGKVENNNETLPVFQQPDYTCKAPKAGEAPGKGPNGQVCTWSTISGATEEGRNFEDYGNCDKVRTQRPYRAVPPNSTASDADARLNDPAYAKENEWVKSQLRAAACVCCHTTNAPKGPANWFLESKPNWVNSFGPLGLAMGAGWINTVSFGAYPPDQNNGFTRATPDNVGHSAFPTTDDARMRRFFEAELAHRGKKREDFASQKDGYTPLDIQLTYVPTSCTPEQAIASDGTITWIGGPARYLYVLAGDASSPGVPPNLDIPKGTLWRVDVDWKSGTPFASGSIKYGVLPEGLKQTFPKEGKPEPLVSGKTYYLYVLKDIAFPLTRCLLKAP